MTQDISLVVLSHGLWGVKGHMSYIERELMKKYGETIHIVGFYWKCQNILLMALQYIVEFKRE
jgi:hypothetical protein